jgi:hypothetical protein
VAPTTEELHSESPHIRQLLLSSTEDKEYDTHDSLDENNEVFWIRMVKTASLLKTDKMEEKKGEKVSRSPFHALALRQTATPLVQQRGHANHKNK